MKKYTQHQDGFLIKLGQNIRRIRVLKGFSQQQVSAFCDIEESGISRIENGKTNSTISTIKKIADALTVGIAEVFNGI